LSVDVRFSSVNSFILKQLAQLPNNSLNFLRNDTPSSKNISAAPLFYFVPCVSIIHPLSIIAIMYEGILYPSLLRPSFLTVTVST